jgi:hypothetical protein
VYFYLELKIVMCISFLELRENIFSIFDSISFNNINLDTYATSYRNLNFGKLPTSTDPKRTKIK